jgi:hypothetical protein
VVEVSPASTAAVYVVENGMRPSGSKAIICVPSQRNLPGGCGADRHRRALELEVVDRRQRDHRLVEDRGDRADQARLLHDRAGAQQLQRPAGA